MAANYDDKCFMAIAESLGFKLLIAADENDQENRVFIIQHEPTNAELWLDEAKGAEVLAFLNTAHWAFASQALEARVAALEKATPQHRDTTESSSDAPQKAGVDLGELCARAIAIGAYVQEQNEKIIYCRYRYKIPGTRYEFYFTSKNAMNPRRRHCDTRCIFAPSELDELARWIAHDEKIFAESNRAHSVPQG